MESSRIVLGCAGAARAAALTNAVAGRCAHDVVAVWPQERAVATGGDARTAVVVLDGPPTGTTLAAVSDATGSRRDLAVLVLAPLSPDLDVLVALASGVSGYLPADSEPATVAEAVVALLAGDTVLPRAVAGPLVQHLRWGGRGIVITAPGGAVAELTNREWEVLVLLRQQRTTAEIARRLFVSTGTVRSHVAAVLRKLGAPDRAGAAGADWPERTLRTVGGGRSVSPGGGDAPSGLTDPDRRALTGG